MNSRIAKTVRCHFAFTRVDLLAVVFALGILFLVLLPAVARSRVKPQGTQCFSNLRQLAMAWMMYADENHGKIMPNSNSSPLGYGGGSTTSSQWVLGSLSWAPSTADNTNTSYLAHSSMGPYLNYQTAVFKCPSDYWQCTEGGALMNRVRSYSINYCMEGDGDDATKIGQHIPLDQVAWNTGQPRYGYHRLTDMGARLPGPNPVNAWVLCDEHPDTINNGALAWGSLSTWADLPASYHESGDNFAFADGHVEYHPWLSGYNAVNNSGICRPVTQQSFADPTVGFNPVDYNWVTSHGTATYP